MTASALDSTEHAEATTTHALRRHPPRHLHHRRRARQRRLLHPRARPADGEEDRQPGRPDRLPPLLRRRARERRAPTSRSSSTRAPAAAAPATGMVHTITFRVASEEALDFWEARLARGGHRHHARARTARASTTRRGSGSSWRSSDAPDEPLVARHPEIPAELALQGFDGVRAFAAGSRSASRRLLEDVLGFSRTGDADWEARGAARGGLYALRRAARVGRGHPGRRHRPPRRVGLDDGRARGVAAPGDRGRHARDAGDRPVLVPLDLLPRAERRALRDRDARARLRDRRGPRPPRRVADPAARVRAPARADRAGADADPGPAQRLGATELVATLDPRRRKRDGPPAETAEGALVLLHGRGADEHDLFPLLDLARSRSGGCSA